MNYAMSYDWSWMLDQIDGFMTAAAIEDEIEREGEEGKNDCFIATAAYGTPFASEIGVLRRWRDESLLTNAPGRLFVRFYYWMSPPVAGFIAQREFLKRVVRIILKPMLVLIRKARG